MAYEIRKYNGDLLLSLEDGHTDSANSSLTLIGKNVTSFGKSQNENLIHLLENFAADTAPASQIKGQLWYDSSQYKLKVWNGGGWVELTQIDYIGAEPTASRAGQLWFNTATSQLYMNVGTSGNDFRFIGPDLVVGAGTTRLVSTSTLAVTSRRYPVINITVNGEVVGIISTASFILDSSNSVEGFLQINRGINLVNDDSTDFQLYGRSTYSNLATTATNLGGTGIAGQIPYQIDRGNTGFISTGTAGQLLVSGGSSSPSFVNTTSVRVGYATTSSNLAGGGQGSLPYQTAIGLTTQLSLGTYGYFLTADTTGPKWSNPASLSVGESTTAAQANTLKDSESSNYYAASVNASVNTIVQRANDGKVYANTFTGDLVGNVTGVSSIATKLQTARTIALTGAISGSATFDGSANVSITTTAVSQFPQGMIVMWAGSSGSIPIGWVLCNGLNGTPDLRDRFVMGSGGTYVTGSNGGSNSTTITAENLPAHQHDFNAVYALKDDAGPGVTDRNGNRLQAYDGWGDDGDNDSGDPAWYYGRTELSGGTVSPTPLTLMPKYYAIAFIMKT